MPPPPPGTGALPSVPQTPEEERGLLHADSNGYTNLPDVVQPSHSPTESGKGHSPPSKDGGGDVSGHGRPRSRAAVGGVLGGPAAGLPDRSAPPNSTSLAGW